MDCLSDDRVLGFLRGALPEAEREAIETHLDACVACFKLVGAAMRLGGDAGAPEVEDDTAEPSEDSASLAPTSIADGRYVIRELLGQGGAGAVHRAYDVQLGRPVALKIVRPPQIVAGTAEALQARLLREARAMARVSHPNVVAVYDVGSIGDRVFVVMELVEGRTLAAWQREQTRSWREVVEMFTAAGVGLAAAHRVGLVHRDFKPLNVLVGIDGRVRVTDFGLARPVAQADSGETTPSRESFPEALPEWTLTMTGGLVGTPRYMAPEQFRAGVADERSDQFSFCVALFAALYRHHPFIPERVKKPSLPELASLVLHGEIQVRAAPEGMPPGILGVLRRGLSAEPSARYPSMDALIADLTKQAKPARMGRITVASLLLGVAAIVLGIVAWSRSITAEPDPVKAETAPSMLTPPFTTPAAPVALTGASSGSAPAALASAPAPQVSSRPRPAAKPAAPRLKAPAPVNPNRLKDPF